jgi:SAM-dependent methyltransferase
LNKEDLKELIRNFAGGPLLPWEEHYLDYHAARYLDTLAILGPGKGLRLLDVGSFPGHLTIAAHHLGYQVEGLTGKAESIPSLEMIVDRLSRYSITTALADVETEPFPFSDGVFDVVLASEIIEHLHFNPYRLLKESFRVLKPGGRILITTPNIGRLENVIRLIKGLNIHSEISGRFYESFSSILSARHIREFTASDLEYMLEAQNKETYRFEEVRLHFSKCLDPSLPWPRLAGLIDRFRPRFRSTLMVEAFRPRTLAFIHPEEVEPVSGVYAVEEHGSNMDGIARILTTPFRWTGEKAHLQFPAGEGSYQILYFNVVYLVPESLPPREWTVEVKGQFLTNFSLLPDRMFTQVRLAIPRTLAENGFFSLAFSGPTWKPIDHPVANDYEFSTQDQRDLGIVIGWDGFLQEDCPNEEALQKAAQREIRLLENYENFNERVHWRKMHHGFDDRWSHLKTLYLPGADFQPTIIMGEEDWRQLGTGWYFLENWEDGKVRWTSRWAEAYLGVKADSDQLRIRAFTGNLVLGDQITGYLKVFYSADRLSFDLDAENSFDLPKGIWTDLVVHFPQKIKKGGLIRLVIEVDQARSPALLVPGSTDTRELGLAVTGITLR